MKNNFSKIILVLVVPFILGITTTQPLAEEYWEKTYGGSLGDRGSSVQQTFDGGYIIAGLTNLINGYEPDILLIKTDVDGNELWSKTFGGSEWDGSGYGTEVQQTTGGGYIIGSATRSFGSGGWDVYLIKTDADGNEVWSKTFGDSRDEIGTSVQQTTDGGYIIAGEKWSGYYDTDFYLVKANSDGDMEWEKTFGSTGWGQHDRGRSVRQTADGGYILVGSTGDDVYLIKTDPNGNELWSRTFGDSENDNAGSVQQTLDGGYIIAGYTRGSGPPGDSYLIKTDSEGYEVWSKTLGYDDHDAASSVQQTTDGGYVITGFVGSSVYLYKTDTEGNEQWSKTFGGEAERGDRGSSVQQTADGGYIVAGTKSLYSGEDDVYLIYYKPIISIDIDIKPGSYPNSINPHSKGKIPVAILSSMDFDAPTEVDTESLTFGPFGDEESLAFCSRGSEDVNDDGYDDIVCHFYTQMTGFECGDEEGILKGQTLDETPLEGSDSVRIVPSACR